MTHDNFMWFGGGFMWLFWIVLIVALVFLVKGLAGNSSDRSKENTPLSILEKRYASGEIDDEEYRHKRRELEADK